MQTFEIIKTVRLTEKGTRQGDKFNQYTVVADPRANKSQIRQAVQDLFKVKVTRVNTMNVRGKDRRRQAKKSKAAQNGTRDVEVNVTVSVGVAARDEERTSPDLVIRSADKALYRAKAKGRNRTIAVKPASEEMRIVSIR